jgi:leader peptidase (prepilin peptidase)/N-methyltransferase
MRSPLWIAAFTAAVSAVALLLDLFVASRLRAHLRRLPEPSGPPAGRDEPGRAAPGRVAAGAVTLVGTPEPLMLLLSLAMRPSVLLAALLAVRRAVLKVPGVAWACRHAPFFPLFELAFAALALGLLGLHGWGETCGRGLLFLVFALPLGWVSWQDSENCISPDIFTLGGTVAGLAAAFASFSRGLPARSFEAPLDAVAGAVWLGGGGWLIGYLYKRFRGIDGIGLGAVKTLWMIGAFWGIMCGTLAVFLASFAGLLIGVAIMAAHRDGLQREIPFTPLLVLAGIACAFAGPAVSAWFAVPPTSPP